MGNTYHIIEAIHHIDGEFKVLTARRYNWKLNSDLKGKINPGDLVQVFAGQFFEKEIVLVLDVKEVSFNSFNNLKSVIKKEEI